MNRISVKGICESILQADFDKEKNTGDNFCIHLYNVTTSVTHIRNLKIGNRSWEWLQLRRQEVLSHAEKRSVGCSLPLGWVCKCRDLWLHPWTYYSWNRFTAFNHSRHLVVDRFVRVFIWSTNLNGDRSLFPLPSPLPCVHIFQIPSCLLTWSNNTPRNCSGRRDICLGQCSLLE